MQPTKPARFERGMAAGTGNALLGTLLRPSKSQATALLAIWNWQFLTTFKWKMRLIFGSVKTIKYDI